MLFCMEDAGILFQGPFFTMEYPDFWEVEIIEDIPAFYDPMGGGALQVAAVRREDGEIQLSEEMESYLTGMDLEYDPEKMQVYEHQAGPCIACEFIKDSRFWLINIIGKEGKLLIIMYNSDEIPDEDTVKILMQMIQSIRMTGND